MKIATIQFAPVFGNLSFTIEKLKPLLKKSEEADIVVLPELANSGYNFGSLEEAKSLSENTNNSVFVEFLRAQCELYQFKIATGFSELEGNQLYNSSLLIDKKGVIGKYRKLHLFMNEKKFFNPGNLALPIFEVDNVKIGMLICFDWMFPEVWRKLALKGADIILHPSNLVLPYAQSVIPSYALVNRTYIVTSNRIGTEKELTVNGQSIIANPKGEVLARAGKGEEIIMLDIDPELSRNKMITPLNDAFKDRRTDIYE